MEISTPVNRQYLQKSSGVLQYWLLRAPSRNDNKIVFLTKQRQGSLQIQQGIW